MDRLRVAAHVTLAYALAQFLIVPVTKWMLMAWLGVFLVLAGIFAIMRFLAKELSPGRAQGVHWWPVVSASLSFIILAVMTATLETSRIPLVGTYWSLSIGLVLVVGLYLASYERSRKPKTGRDAG